MKYILPEPVQKCINILENNGHEVFCVGGAVRDMIMGKQPIDYDLTTSATPDTVISLFSKSIPTGIAHGTVTVIIDKTAIEITTYRFDGTYSNHRKPDSIKFLNNIKNDLARRDFTINAICYNPKTGIYDPYNGIEDINNKTIRTVGVPEHRFADDALRIMRCFRFACCLGFEIEPLTYNAALEHVNDLKKISEYRIQTEICKALLSDHPSKLLPLIDSGALSKFGITGTDGRCNIIDSLPRSLTIRLAYLCKSSKTNVEKFLTELKFDNNTKNSVIKIYKYLQHDITADKVVIKHLLAELTEKELLDLISYKEIINKENCGCVRSLLSEVVLNNEPYNLKMLNVSGYDLKNLGITGKNVGILLNDLLEKCIYNPELNTKESLLKIAKQSLHNSIFHNIY